MFAVLDRTGLLVAYDSWDEWRDECRAAATQEPAPLCACDVVFCAHCWGQARILSPARNGEGLVPRPCPTCAGTGVVRR